MLKQSHLETYQVILTTQSPVFVGSGTCIKKTEYCYYPNMRRAYIIDQNKFFHFLMENQLIDKYEEFVFSGNGDLAGFLRSCGYDHNDVSQFMLYSTDVGDALNETGANKDIHCFMRNQRQQAYIPGSSLKGALRTVLLTKMIAKQPYPNTSFTLWDKKAEKQMQQYYFHRLKLKENKRDLLNDIMRTISISDSEPIDNSAFTLCGKQDVAPDGSVKKINVVRECVKPGVEIRFALTIDKSFGKYISVEEIRAAIADYASYYHKEYLRYFPGAQAGTLPPNSIFIGGGSGYFSKNVVYPILGHERAVRAVSDFMRGKFPAVRHEIDLQLGISPRKLKCTSYRRMRYQFGLCQVEIQ